MLDAKRLKFRVGDCGEVLLCMDMVKVEVCDSVAEFAEFREKLVAQLALIEKELAGTYLTNNAANAAEGE